MTECPCPACGFLTIGENIFGSYSICGVCGWEDDQVQLSNPTTQGGANQYSLLEAQTKALSKIPSQVIEFKGFYRDKKWRPLRPSEVEVARSHSSQEPWKYKGIISYEDAYWNVNLIPKDIEVEIKATATSDGGRSSPIVTGYRPQFYYDSKDWVVSLTIEEINGIAPGESGKLFIGFMSPIEHSEILSVGLNFELREGTRTVASGVVTRIIDLLFSSDLQKEKS